MMAETPKKIVDCEYVFTPSSAGKSVVDLACLIEWKAGEDLSAYQTAGADLFMCDTTCYKVAFKFRKGKEEVRDN